MQHHPPNLHSPDVHHQTQKELILQQCLIGGGVNHKRDSNLPCSLPKEQTLAHFDIYRTMAHVHGAGRRAVAPFPTHHHRVNHNATCTKWTNNGLDQQTLQGALFTLQMCALLF